MRVLLTGGSGFIAAHILDELLAKGHSIVTTVRSQEKADRIKEAHPNTPKEQLDFVIVEDIAVEGAFNKAVVSDPPFEAIIHTASPFHYNVTDIQKDLIDPAVIGTTGILKSTKANAPTVKRIVITSSFAAIVNPKKGLWPGHTYSEVDWNPVTLEDAKANPQDGYRASKTWAEKAAWEFVEKEKPNFSITTINPPFVFGPIVHYLNSLSALNTSNLRIRDLIDGKFKEKCPPTGTFIWTDVRDLATGHVNALDTPEAVGRRIFFTAGILTLPKSVNSRTMTPNDEAGGYPSGGLYSFDNNRAKEILGIKFRTLEESIADTVKSLKAVGL
ncbi:NAD(P)-binding protein [Patellaria atrata CBS 101060]|uniref:NAD(P)-binding protein n=1 Tax=Patellaria atrata CBS 101060 TaxID=1346257 RepID=A0A9P4VVM0_9PEZI|nr:NAD(P)-binding protein [Patellaria atrata CBS 101060]